MAEVLYEAGLFDVVVNDQEWAGYQILREDGNYHDTKGYLVVNRDTNVVEHTTMIFAQAIYQAIGFNDSINALTKTKGIEADIIKLADVSTEDVVPN